MSIGKNVESSERFYENYDTIDWIRDMIRDSRRREDLLSKSVSFIITLKIKNSEI